MGPSGTRASCVRLRPRGRGVDAASPVDLDPAALAGAGGDRVADEHLVVAVRERGIAGAGGDSPGYHVRVNGPEMGAEGVEEPLDMTARQGSGRSPGLAEHGRVPDEDLVGRVAV